MNNENALLWLVPLLPLAGFFICALLGSAQDKNAQSATPEHAHGNDDEHTHDAPPAGQRIAGAIATGVVALAFLLSAYLVFFVLSGSGEEKRIFSPRFEWMFAPAVNTGTNEFRLTFGLFTDHLNGLMMLIITGVGALIHLYSIGYMSHERNYARYFSYLNLFVFFMLLLVMGNSLVTLFIGWEGVGLASYLLIGFWTARQAASDAGKKAFIVNRIGDCALLIALFLIYKHFGTLDMYGQNGILTKAGLENAISNGYEFADMFGLAVSTIIPLLLLLGAAGKSAQIPLYVWLPDAMEGPTPVSALIHAATMVTGGVYLICRTHALFLMSDSAMTIVAVIGISTAFVAATIALTQNDIKRVLAYSTVSQLGYMFLACGVGAFGAAMFHVMTHAFFKALLFLGAGSVIHGLSGEQDMRRMGGLRSKMPTTYLTMLIGTLAIAGVPIFAGFWSKDEILYNAFLSGESGLGHWSLWATGLVISGMTAFYMTRMLVKTFHGDARYTPEQAKHLHESPPSMTLPLVVLAFLSVVGGLVNTPWMKLFDGFLGETVEWKEAHSGGVNSLEIVLLFVSAAVAVVAVGLTWNAFGRAREGNLSNEVDIKTNPLWRLFDNKWGIDAAYTDFFARQGMGVSRFFSRVLDRRIIEGATVGAGGLILGIAGVFRRWQSGYVRNYALGMLVGVIILVLSLVGLTAFR